MTKSETTSEHAAWEELEKRAAFWAEMAIRGAELSVLDDAASQVGDAIRVYKKARLRGPGVIPRPRQKVEDLEGTP